MVGLGWLYAFSTVIVHAVVPPGTGSVGLVYPFSGSSCPSCAAGQSGQTAPTVTYSVEMGQLLFGGSAGQFRLSQIKPSPQMATPGLLQFTGQTDLTNGEQVVTNYDGTISQIVAPQAFATVTTNSPFSYQITFYYPGAVGPWNGSAYVVTNASANLITTWIVTNLDATNVSKRLQITETPNGGTTRAWLYCYNSTNTVWTLTMPDGSMQYFCQSNAANGNLYEMVQMTSSNGVLVYAHSMLYTNLTTPYSILSGMVIALPEPALLTDTAGAGAAAKVTKYTYNSDGKVQSIIRPDGSQEYYNSYNAQGLLTDVHYSFQDDPTGRETTYDYDPSDAVPGSGDDGSIQPSAPRRVIGYVEGHEVSRQYTIFQSAGVHLNIQCTTPGAAWNDSHNFVTTNLYYTSGPNQYSLKAVIQPDGTMTTYNYYIGSAYQTNVTATGQPDPTYSYIVDGVSNVTVLNTAGSLVTAASYDVRSDILLSRDNYGAYDNFGRPQQVVHLDGTTNKAYYACCGVDLTIDPDSLVTQYLYDSEKRQIGYEKVYNGNPITYSNVLDATGRTLQSIRFGTDNSAITMGQWVYDSTGELIAQTNALGGGTTYTRTNDPTTGGLITTTVNPDTGVTTNFYYADGSLKKTVGTAVHGKAYGYGYGLDVNGNTCMFTVETNLNADGSSSSEWTKTYSDMAGRATETLYADGHYDQSFYNTKGQLAKQVDPDGVITLYQYNAKGELAYTAVDMNQNGSIDFSGTDRIMQTTNDVTTDHGANVLRSRTYVWLDGQSTGTLVSSDETSVDCLNSWQTQYRDASTPVTSHSQTVPGISRTVTNTAPDGSYNVTGYSYGLQVSSKQYDSTGAQIGGTTYGYDAHGRQNTMTDARNGTTTYGFNNADEVNSVVTPVPGSGLSAETTTTLYDNMERSYSVIQPDSTTVNSIYLLTGELGLQYGSRTYPVAYSYDYAGRMKTMTNWSNYSSIAGARVTTWNYDSQRGWLTGKIYDGGPPGPSYTYTAAGRLQDRSWVRGVVTTYKYSVAGDLTNVLYSDSTPAVTNNYDRLGRVSSVLNNGMTDTLAYNLANELLGETFSGGTLNGLAITNSYDQYLRRTNLTSLNGAFALAMAVYSYDNASRLSTVSDGTDNATYNYVANSPLVSQITLKQGSTTRMTTTKQYDYLNRLTQISSAPSAAYTLPLTYNYNYNPANQRTKDTLADGSYWVYGYDSLGQVTNGCKYFFDGTLVPGQQFGYLFDDIGNRKQTAAGGDATGSSLRLANYTANNLNQITARDYPGTNDIIGASLLTNAVTVNGQTVWRKGEYFWSTVKTNNTVSAQWLTATVASGSTTNAGNIYFPKTQEQFGYDPDGNLTNDGRFAYVWDGENRLAAMTNNTGVGPRYGLTFGYDYQGRRTQKVVATNGVPVYTNRFLYDGWNLIAELNPASSPVRSYMWGMDLSGSMQGAGGVGELLEISYYGTTITNCLPAFDGNGNLMALVNAADGTLVANYEYGPFGELLRATGPMAKANPFRWSTRYQDDESDIVMYPCRPYRDGRFLNRDLIEEAGGDNLYGFVNNSPVNAIDPLGLVIETHCDSIDDYLNSLGISFQRTGSYHYNFLGSDLGTGNGDAKMIVARMLFAGTVFTVSSTGGSATANLKKHVDARLTIIRNALKANFLFGAGQFHFDPAAFQKDPQVYFDSLNNGNTKIACYGLSRLIFETGNRFAPQGVRRLSGPTPASLVWIPGDWGWIENKNFGAGWERGYEGENVIHTGKSGEGEMFWGHFKPGVHPAMAESWWFNFVKHWPGPGGQGGDPQWLDAVKYTTVGLDRPTTR
jgi:RHS repeat-associated protein